MNVVSSVHEEAAISARQGCVVTAATTERGEFERSRIMLDLLESVERDSTQTQRGRAFALGVALGLVNAYLKRCVKKGLVKVSEAPTRRYAYYLTPQGLTEKSRLTLEYLSYSFSLFRRARTEYLVVLNAARGRGFRRLVLAGVSDLAEIATLCAINNGTQLVAIIDPNVSQSRFVGLPVFRTLDEVSAEFDAMVVTDVRTTSATYADAVGRLGADRVFVPAFLAGLAQGVTAEAAQ